MSERSGAALPLGLNHADAIAGRAAFSMRVYAKAVRRRERLHAGHLEAFDAALQLARIGANAESAPMGLAGPRGRESAQPASESYKWGIAGRLAQ
jgi:hypothetical protein